MGDRRAKHGHHSVANVLVYCAAQIGDGAIHSGEVLVQHGMGSFRAEFVGE